MAAPNAWHRAELARVRREMAQRVGKQFLHLNLGDLDGSWWGYADEAQDAVQAAARLAALQNLDYFRIWLYDEVGEVLAEQWLQSTVRIDLNEVQAMLRLKGPIEVKRLIAAGWNPVEAYRSALLQTVNVSQGYVHRIGMESMSEVMTGHTQVLQGWRRIVSPAACSFCRRLTGVVWRPSQSWVKPHDKCSCTAEPVANSVRVRRILSPIDRARNERLRQFIAARKDRERRELVAPLAA